MVSPARKKQEHQVSVEQTVVETAVAVENGEVTENIVEFITKSKLIAQQSEDACNLPGNNSSADLDDFIEKYGFDCFV